MRLRIIMKLLRGKNSPPILSDLHKNILTMHGRKKTALCTGLIISLAFSCVDYQPSLELILALNGEAKILLQHAEAPGNYLER